jgi:hypothetical protein
MLLPYSEFNNNPNKNPSWISVYHLLYCCFLLGFFFDPKDWSSAELQLATRRYMPEDRTLFMKAKEETHDEWFVALPMRPLAPTNLAILATFPLQVLVRSNQECVLFVGKCGHFQYQGQQCKLHNEENHTCTPHHTMLEWPRQGETDEQNM